jgi:hypothetical protein
MEKKIGEWRQIIISASRAQVLPIDIVQRSLLDIDISPGLAAIWRLFLQCLLRGA